MQAPSEPLRVKQPSVRRSRVKEALRDFAIYVLGGLLLGMGLGILRWALGEFGLASKVSGDVVGWVAELSGTMARIGFFIFLALRVISVFRRG